MQLYISIWIFNLNTKKLFIDVYIIECHEVQLMYAKLKCFCCETFLPVWLVFLSFQWSVGGAELALEIRERFLDLQLILLKC